MTTTTDPVKRTAELICNVPESNAIDSDSIKASGEHSAESDTVEQLERRLKQDIFASIGRIKPAMTANVDFESDVMTGDFFTGLPAPLQGIAIARCEGALAFYNRVGWRPEYLDAALANCVPAEGIEPLTQRYHASTLHDLAYVHPKHFEKMLGKTGAASLWESLKRYSQSVS